MSDKHYVGLDLVNFEDKKKMRPISRVTFLLDNESSITAGDDTGLEIVASNPHATQAMANAVLARLRGYRYQAFEAESANLDPAAELGDGITAGGVYGFIGRLNDDGNGYPDVDATGESELDDEYPSAGPMTQEFNRKIAQTRSSITKTAEQIRLEVANDIKGLSASFTVQLEGIESKVTGLNGQMSSITQTVNSITARVTGLEGNYSSIEQTAKSLQIQITDAAGAISRIDQYVDSLTLSVSNGSISSSISLKAGNATISSKDITFSGFATFAGLSGGTTTIDGACIKTGIIDAERLNLTGSITFSDLSTSLYAQISSGITSQQAKTLINSTLVSSPNIAGGKFYNLAQTSWIEIGSNFGKYGLVLRDRTFSDSDPVFGVFNGDFGYASITVKGKDILLVNVTPAAGINAPECNPYGTWDFSNASVTGLNTASISLGAAEHEPAVMSSTTDETTVLSNVTLSDDNGRLKVKTDGVAWYLDATGWHK